MKLGFFFILFCLQFSINSFAHTDILPCLKTLRRLPYEKRADRLFTFMEEQRINLADGNHIEDFIERSLESPDPRLTDPERQSIRSFGRSLPPEKLEPYITLLKAVHIDPRLVTESDIAFKRRLFLNRTGLIWFKQALIPVLFLGLAFAWPAFNEHRAHQSALELVHKYPTPASFASVFEGWFQIEEGKRPREINISGVQLRPEPSLTKDLNRDERVYYFEVKGLGSIEKIGLGTVRASRLLPGAPEGDRILYSVGFFPRTGISVDRDYMGQWVLVDRKNK